MIWVVYWQNRPSRLEGGMQNVVGSPALTDVSAFLAFLFGFFLCLNASLGIVSDYLWPDRKVTMPCNIFTYAHDEL